MKLPKPTLTTFTEKCIENIKITISLICMFLKIYPFGKLRKATNRALSVIYLSSEKEIKEYRNTITQIHDDMAIQS